MNGSGTPDSDARTNFVQRDTVPVATQSATPDLRVVRALIADQGARHFSPKILSLTHNFAAGLVQELSDSGVFAGDIAEQDAMTAALLADDDFLSHLYALAIEVDLLDRRSVMLGEDPVLSPGLQRLVADQDSGLAGLAVRFVAAQARFVSQAARMQIACAQLPAHLFAQLLRLAVHGDSDVANNERRLSTESALSLARTAYDEAATRQALGARLADQVMALGMADTDAAEWGVSLRAFMAEQRGNDRLLYLCQYSPVQ